MEVSLKNLQSLSSATSDEEWTVLANTLWSIWRCRYDSNVQLDQGNGQILCQVPPQCPNGVAGTYRAKEIATTAKELFTGKGPTGDTGDPLLAYKSAGFMAWSPLHAEAKAMEEAIRFVKDAGITPLYLLNRQRDTGAEACNDFEPPVNVDWNLEGV